MKDLDSAIREGHYAKKQIACSDWLISWSHRRRFAVAMRLAREFAGKRVLDYGSGDGMFVAMLMRRAQAPAEAVGVEMSPSVIEECQGRLGSLQGVRFVVVADLEKAEHVGAYDAIVCMEVLEHVVDLAPILAMLDRLLAPSGKLLVSVPVETGLPLIVKQVVRRVAGWRRLGDYPGQTPYSVREYRASLFAGNRQHILRPIHRNADGSVFHDHKGFNWKVLEAAIARRFEVEKRVSSPLPWLPTQLATQVFLLARKTG